MTTETAKSRRTTVKNSGYEQEWKKGEKKEKDGKKKEQEAKGKGKRKEKERRGGNGGKGWEK